MEPRETIGYRGWKDGEVIDVDPFTMTRRVYRDIDDKHGAIVTEYLATEDLKEVNAAEQSETRDQRWGDGKIIGRVPFHLLNDPNVGLMQAIRNHDGDFVRRWLNENPSLKTRERI